MRYLPLFLLLAGCMDCPEECRDYCCRGFWFMGNYEIDYSTKTDTGIAFDDTEQGVPPEAVDQAFDEVDECLAKNFPDGTIPEEVKTAAMCPKYATIPPFIKRQCITVKIPDDWQWSCDGTDQALNMDAPDYLCEAKGLHPTKECPCRWRAAIQPHTVIITTPNLHLLKDPLIRIATGCNNPWGHPLLAECATNESI